MGAWQAPSTSATEAQGGSPGEPHGWPHSVVRWLFGLGEEHHQPAALDDPGRPISEHLRQPGGRSGRRRSGADDR